MYGKIKRLFDLEQPLPAGSTDVELSLANDAKAAHIFFQVLRASFVRNSTDPTQADA